ncbi:MAG: hypothetical protein PHC38_04065 [Weeksellaceae bacterium]|nr:hypothetical protein [Weeksellaceae bacterium]
MKKITYFIALANLVFAISCTKKSKESDAEQITNTSKIILENKDAIDHNDMKTMVVTINDIPEFKDQYVQQFAEEYANFFNHVMEVANSNDSEKIEHLLEQSVEWSKKANEIVKTMDPEDVTTWNKWASQLPAATLSE